MTKDLVRKLTRSGKYSYVLVLPARIIKEFGWRERQKLAIKISHRAKRLVIEDYKPDRKK